jgi:hypothetical protein
LLTATPLGPAHRSDSRGFLRVRKGPDLARIDRPRQMGARGPEAPASLDLYGQSSTEEHPGPVRYLDSSVHHLYRRTVVIL